MSRSELPERVEEIQPGEPFSFLCHREINCFTHCCRQLDLALSPYDMLRLRKATGLHSAELLERYIIREQNRGDIFPLFYLSMVDDGQASCVFVTPEGCRVYEHRPGACRTYPMGRASLWRDGGVEESFVLLKEPHCQGFREKTVQTTKSYSASQELETYNLFNDMLAEITQHEKIRQGMELSEKQLQIYTLALYNLDAFRAGLQKIGDAGTEVPQAVFSNDDALLIYGLEWVKKELFGSL
jgi:Fe-S-cluster containining protein